MPINFDENDQKRFKSARQITEIIAAHGKHMTSAALDRALSTWDILVKSGPTRGPNKIGTAKTSVDNQEEVEPMEKSRKDVLMARGRAFVKAGCSPREAAKLALEVEQKTDVNRCTAASPVPKSKQATAQPEKHIRWGSRPGAWGNERLMAEDSAPVMPQASQAARHQVSHGMGPAAWGYEKKDISKLTGHQQAALKVGVDIDRVSTTELAQMNGNQMQALAQRQQLDKLAELRTPQRVYNVRQWGVPNDLGDR